MRAARDDDRLELFVLAVGSHFLSRKGRTIDEIVEEGILVDEAVVFEFDDSAAGVSKAVGETVSGSTQALRRLQPDIVVVLGDRYEILAVALASNILGVPVAHIAGGDTTLGAYDENFRHALTKLSHLHFTTNSAATARVLQLGEEPWRIHEVGSPGIDALLQAKLLSREELEERLEWRFRPRNLLVTFHPVTLLPSAGMIQAQALVDALEAVGEDVGVVVTGANADGGGDEINALLRDFCSRNVTRALHVDSLGSLVYLSMLSQVDAVVGNSSSGLYEAPSLGTPTVDIGERQEGRPRARSVIHSPATVEGIVSAIDRAIAQGRKRVKNPYGAGSAAREIISVLSTLPSRDTLLMKSFVSREKVER